MTTNNSKNKEENSTEEKRGSKQFVQGNYAEKFISQCLLMTGIVQGVGFRPFIYRIATEEKLAGYVRNTSKGVEVKISGAQAQLDEFHRRLYAELPPLAELDQVEEVEGFPDIEEALETKGADEGQETNKSFLIISSHAEVKGKVKIPADIAICPDCRQEIITQSDRHYYYQLTNCTNCGPRFTVIRDVPYDRALTTMADFTMCPDCQAEYLDPLDRRFHAQPTACPVCGPKTQLIRADGEILATGADSLSMRELIGQVVNILQAGKIVAIKGVGGFHFVCNADDDRAVAKLRQRKGRPSKPLAVMAKDLDTIKKRARISEIEAKKLASPQAPIVILDKLDWEDFALVAPDMPTVGVMVPYTPLQVLLFASGAPDWLVMTSANPSKMPITKDNDEALAQLASNVDYFLIHEREIEQRCDDSLIRIQRNPSRDKASRVNQVRGGQTSENLAGETASIIRAGRGYTPRMVDFSFMDKTIEEKNNKGSKSEKIVEEKTSENIDFKINKRNDEIRILAVGGEMKNAFAYLKDGQAILSQHIGEIDSWEGRENFIFALGHYERLFDLEPDIIAHDMHPTYQISEVARLLTCQEHIEIQHHHAHLAACMAEHSLVGQTLGIILDGTGYGDDETLWGSEFLLGDYGGYQRLTHGHPLPVVGGDRPIREPWRMAVTALYSTLGEPGRTLAYRLWADRQAEIDILIQLLTKDIQTIASSGMGRVFDSIAAILGLCEISTYEGEAAISLENAASYYLYVKGKDQANKQKTYKENISRENFPENIYEIKIIESDNDRAFDWPDLYRQIVADLGRALDKIKFQELTRGQDNADSTTQSESGNADMSRGIEGLKKKVYRKAYRNIEIAEIAYKVHVSLAQVLVQETIYLVDKHFRPKNLPAQVVLSGGSWHNELLMTMVKGDLARAGIPVYSHQLVPTNDGGIALGQLAIAAYQRRKHN